MPKLTRAQRMDAHRRRMMLRRVQQNLRTPGFTPMGWGRPHRDAFNAHCGLLKARGLDPVAIYGGAK